MIDINELAQSHELLIANGQQTADLLRHLADNEIDSDYFAVVSECESYGKETDAELSITEFALRAAGYVEALVEALEKAQSRTVTVKLPDDEDGQAYGFGKWANGKLPATAGTMTIAYCEDAWRAAFEVFSSAAGIKVEAE